MTIAQTPDAKAHVSITLSETSSDSRVSPSRRRSNAFSARLLGWAPLYFLLILIPVVLPFQAAETEQRTVWIQKLGLIASSLSGPIYAELSRSRHHLDVLAQLPALKEYLTDPERMDPSIRSRFERLMMLMTRVSPRFRRFSLANVEGQILLDISLANGRDRPASNNRSPSSMVHPAVRSHLADIPHDDMLFVMLEALPELRTGYKGGLLVKPVLNGDQVLGYVLLRVEASDYFEDAYLSVLDAIEIDDLEFIVGLKHGLVSRRENDLGWRFQAFTEGQEEADYRKALDGFKAPHADSPVFSVSSPFSAAFETNLFSPGARRREDDALATASGISVLSRQRGLQPALSASGQVGEGGASLDFFVAVTGSRSGPFEQILQDLKNAPLYWLSTGFIALLFACLLSIATRILIANYQQRRLSRDKELARLKLLADRDDLTGVLNRRAFLQIARQWVEDNAAADTEISLLMIDVDHFKRINDNLGHHTGDSVLRSLVVLMQRELRPDDLLARYGGEEFIIGFIGAGHSAASAVAERICRRVSTTPQESDSGAFQVTVSIGVVTSKLANGDALEGALKEADSRLYAAKSMGRNRVVVA